MLEGSGAFYLTCIGFLAFVALIFIAGRRSKCG
jgi:hypothetical protein